MFAAGEEPNDERVNTFHKPKRIETILEALNPEETQLVFMVAVPQIKEVVSQVEPVVLIKSRLRV